MTSRKAIILTLSLSLAALSGCRDSESATSDSASETSGTDLGSDTGSNTGTDTDKDSDTDTALGSITGLVILQGAVSHAGVTVTLDGTNKSQTTSETGVYALHDVAPGTYTVTASLAEYESRTSSPFEVTAGETVTVPPLTLPRATGALSGTALLEGEDSHAGISVMVQGTSYASVTDSTGAWSISNVTAGNYAVIAMREGFKDATVSDQEVVTGQVTNVPTLTLEIPRSSIGGTVTLAGAADYSGASVVATATWNPTLTHSGSTNPSGTYTISDVEPGMWDVVASLSGYYSSTQENVFVQASAPTGGVNFALEAVPEGVVTDIVYVSGGFNEGDPIQSGTVYEALSEPFVVKVVDGYGLPVSNAHVTYTLVDNKTDGHMLTSGMITTGEDGLASNFYVPGKSVGTNHVRVECLELVNDEVEFYADGVPDEPFSLVPMGGSLQSGVVGQELAEPLFVEVRDQWANVVPHQTVRFTPSGDGLAEPELLESDSEGLAATTWTLGTLMGQQSMTVTCGEAQHEFTAIADHDTAHDIIIVSGSNQNGVNTTTLAQPLVVELRDQYANPVNAATVTFAVTQGTGTLLPSEPQVTGTNGRAQVTMTLLSLGSVEVTATAAGVDAVVFMFTSLTGPPHHVVLVSGGGQEGVVGQALAQPIVFRVEDGYNNPVQGAWVDFAAGAMSGSPGSPMPATAQTGETGQVSTFFTLGTRAGNLTQWVTATVDGYPSATLKTYQNPEPDEPASIEIVSGNSQTAAYGQQLDEPFVVLVKDQYVNPVWDELVSWSSTTGGTVTPDPAMTESNGQTAVAATLGSTPGMPDQDFTATAGAVDVTFSAVATGHYIQLIEPWKVWPGYPDPFAADPAVHELEVTIRGAGFESGALMVWDVGGVDEEVFTPDSVTETHIVARITADHFVTLGSHPVTVRNPGPSDCASYEFTVGYMIPDTGQTVCRNESNQQVDCANILPGDALYGQDGHYLQSSLGQHFYTDHGNSTVTDEITGLMWEQVFSDEKMPWSDALTYCEANTTGGYNDWRLPGILELSTLVDAGRSNPPIDPTAFPSTPNEAFWSSSSHAYYSDYAWLVFFNLGYVTGDAKSSDYRVRCVRRGPLEIGHFDAFALSGDRVVTDRQTGLDWQGCAGGQTGVSCSGTAFMRTWPQSLAYCEGLSWAGYSDWRLPNRNELQSIVDYSRRYPSIDTDAFPSTPNAAFWSSSSPPDEGACYINFDLGVVYRSDKLNNNRIRCVRRGP
jgi:hypothetical protein